MSLVVMRWCCLGSSSGGVGMAGLQQCHGRYLRVEF